LVEVACEENYATNDVKLSLLNVISKDKSKHTHWKTILVDIILHSSKTNQLSLDSPLHFFCRNIVQFGMFDVKEASTLKRQTTNQQTMFDDHLPRKEGKTN
jgi:hypothetical protein